MRPVRLALVALGLTTAGCGDIPQARTEAEIQDIAEDVAESVASEKVRALETRLAEMETEISELEKEKEYLQAEIRRLSANDENDTGNIKRLFDNDRAFARRLNIPFE